MIDGFYLGAALDLASLLFIFGLLAFVLVLAREFYLGFHEK